jgi:hypothetical protein
MRRAAEAAMNRLRTNFEKATSPTPPKEGLEKQKPLI